MERLIIYLDMIFIAFSIACMFAGIHNSLQQYKWYRVVYFNPVLGVNKSLTIIFLMIYVITCSYLDNITNWLMIKCVIIFYIELVIGNILYQNKLIIPVYVEKEVVKEVKREKIGFKWEE